MGTTTDDELTPEETAFLYDIEVDAYLLECVNLDDSDLDREFRRVSADLAYWNHRYADALRAALLGKYNVDRTKGRLALEIRAEAEDLGMKVTDKTVDAKVASHDDLHAVYIKYVDAEAEKVKLRGVCEAIAAKKDVLQSLGAKLRVEMERDPQVRRKMADERAAGGGKNDDGW